MFLAPLSSRPSRRQGEPPHVLFVEDNAAIAQLLEEVFEENGFVVGSVGSGEELDRRLALETFDLLVLDVMLPGEDGLSICRRLRAVSSVPIIMLTALGEDVDRIVGLEIGADDYVTKPFNSRELIARAKALVRRARAPVVRNLLRPLGFAGWRLYPGERRLVSPDGAQVATTSAEFDLLLALCQNPGCILSREQLLDLTHGGLAGPIERSVDVHISHIRQKIEHDPRDPALIKTVRLGGYMFTPSVEPLP